METTLLKAHHYFVNGLEIVSEVQLPELESKISPGTAAGCQARFKLQHISDTPFIENKTWFVSESDFQTVYMKIEGVARFLIRNGNEVLIDPLPGVSEKEIRLFLLGSAFGILLHQCGFLPLHASAIKVHGHAVAFVGESGAGKSTLAAFLNSAGYEVICDDVCALTINEQGKPVIWPGVPRIKLWQDALEVLGYDSLSLVQDSYQENKFHLPIHMTTSTPIEIDCIYDLKEIKNSQQCKIRELTGQKKMQTLANNIYRGELVKSNIIRKKIFGQCAAIMNNVNIYSFLRSRDFQLMDECLSELEKHWTENIPGLIIEYQAIHPVLDDCSTTSI